MRTGIDGLPLHVQQALGPPPGDGAAYVLANRRRTGLKMLLRQPSRHFRTMPDRGYSERPVFIELLAILNWRGQITKQNRRMA